jgi:alkylation response protein AidB-like acyl-CoA dehydrogenase
MFADSLGVHAVSGVDEARPIDGGADKRQAAWEAATVGYFAGLASFVVDTAIEHAREREIFGRTLAHLDAVQQRLADAATTTDALALSAREGAHGLPALAHAASSTWSVMLHGHMIFGAIGFTLECPLQRYSRRAKALGAFVDGWIDYRIGYAG